MGIISLEKADHLYWLGRYTERVYTTLRIFFRIYDHMIEEPEGTWSNYCERLNIPDIYTSNGQFVESYLFDRTNPDSILCAMEHAYDNAIVLRDELSSNVLSYVQLALNTFESCRNSSSLVFELQQVIDYLLAFWGCADDYVAEETCRNIMKTGKYAERLDLYIRFNYHQKDIEKEYSKLINRLPRTNLCYNKDNLECLGKMIEEKTDWTTDYQEALHCLWDMIQWN